MGSARAQRDGQTSGNTTKRLTENVTDTRPSKRRRQEEEVPEPTRERDQTPAGSQGQGHHPDTQNPQTPKRSRWSLWRSKRNERPSTEDPQQTVQPTDSGLLGLLVNLRRRAPRDTPPSRVGTGGEGLSTNVWNLEEEGRPPDRGPNQRRTQGSSNLAKTVRDQILGSCRGQAHPTYQRVRK